MAKSNVGLSPRPSLPFSSVRIRSVCSLISTGDATPSIMALGFSSFDSMWNFRSLARPSALNDSGLSSACMSAAKLRSLSVWIFFSLRSSKETWPFSMRTSRREALMVPLWAGWAGSAAGTAAGVNVQLFLPSSRLTSVMVGSTRTNSSTSTLPNRSGHRLTAARSSFIEAKLGWSKPSGLAMVVRHRVSCHDAV